MAGEARYTPTPVGKTLSAHSLATSFAVHPHACGENASSCRSAPSVAVHPHACGENYQPRHGELIGGGTPPRLWGKRSHL